LTLNSYHGYAVHNIYLAMFEREVYELTIYFCLKRVGFTYDTFEEKNIYAHIKITNIQPTIFIEYLDLIMTLNIRVIYAPMPC
jgi:hypothetical protein